MCADVGMKMMEACLQSDSGRQQNKARSAKLSKRVFMVFVSEKIRVIRAIRVQKKNDSIAADRGYKEDVFKFFQKIFAFSK